MAVSMAGCGLWWCVRFEAENCASPCGARLWACTMLISYLSSPQAQTATGRTPGPGGGAEPDEGQTFTLSSLDLMFYLSTRAHISPSYLRFGQHAYRRSR
eukprot:4614320-Prymnesium_polylepis.2